MSLKSPIKTRRRTAATHPVKVQLSMQVGIVYDTCQPGVYILPEAAELLKVSEGDFLEIECEDKGTCIVRELRMCECFLGGRSGYVYMDTESAYYLNGEPHNPVIVRTSTCGVNVP